MTLQQLEYVLAVDEYRHFVKAAEACGVTQSTLSSMIHKLEEEMDLTIFDRNAHPVRPTIAGQGVIAQARVVLFHAHQLKELSLNERERLSGRIHLGITPTIAPYILPKLFHQIESYPCIDIQADEMHRNRILKLLKRAELDMAVMSLPNKDDELLEIPLYRERLYAYVSPQDPLYQQSEVSTTDMPRERLWELKDDVCFHKQLSEFCDEDTRPESRYQSGSITTLIHIVNANKGFTIIPELHIPLLRNEYQKHIRPMTDPVPIREVSLFVRKDYVREGLLNIIADAIKRIVPPEMLDSHISQYSIRL